MHATRSKVILQRSALALMLATAALLGACRGGPGASCTKPGLYVQAQTVPPLRVPAGLDAPDTRGALKVPDLNEPEVPRAAGSPCLDMPPKFSNARLEGPPTSKKKRGKSKDVPPPAPAAAPATVPAAPAAPAAPAPAP
jgi:hypothetical protein